MTILYWIQGITVFLWFVFLLAYWTTKNEFFEVLSKFFVGVTTGVASYTIYAAKFDIIFSIFFAVVSIVMLGYTVFKIYLYLK